MEVVVAAAWDRGVPVTAPPEAVPAAIRDAAKLLHVDVEELARSLTDVADRDAGRAVPVGQAGQAVAAQDVADGRARHSGEGRQAVRAEAELVAGGEDGGDLGLGQAPEANGAGAKSGPRGPQALRSRTGWSHLEAVWRLHRRPCRRRAPRPAVDVHPIHEELPAEDGQFRPTMCHESLPTGVSWIPTPSLGRLSIVNNLFVNHI